MSQTDLTPYPEEIGRLIVDLCEDQVTEALLYAEAGEAWVGASIFQDAGEKIIYRSPSLYMCDKIMEIWDLADDHKKWNTMSYVIADGRFKATFEYSDDAYPQDDAYPEDGSMDRRSRIIKEHYGDKPVDYSDPHGELDALRRR